MISEGIYSENDFIVKINNKTTVLSGRELIDVLDLRINKKNKLDNVFIVGFKNSFVEVDCITIRKSNPYDKIFEIIIDSYRSVIVTSNYPCVVIDKDRKFLVVTPAHNIKPNQTLVPVSKTLQLFAPFAYRNGVGKSIFHLLDAEKESKFLKNYFVASEVKKINKVDVDDGYLININIKEEYKPYLQTSSGILLYSV